MGNTPGHKDDELLKALQDNLPVIRKAANLSQKDLAATMGVSRQTVNNWEREKTFLNPMHGLALMAIFQAMGKNSPSFGRVITAVLERNNEAGSSSPNQSKSPLEARILKYIESRIMDNATLEEQGADDEKVSEAK